MRLLSFAVTAALLASMPATASGQPRQQAAASADVDTFARAAAQNSLTEVLLASMALQKTSDRRVREYAWTMLDHHARAMGDLAEALSAGAAALPTEPSAEQSAALERLRGMSGAQFDQAYLAHETSAHQRAVIVFEQGSRVSDRQVAQYASTTLPILRAHREIVEIRQSQPPQPMAGE